MAIMKILTKLGQRSAGRIT